MTLSQWFNPGNKNHISAYRRLYERGSWPRNFIPKNIEYDEMWAENIALKLAQYYVNYIDFF